MDSIQLTETAADANRHFSGLLRSVSNGAEVTITSRGRPVARMVPIVEDPMRRVAAKQRLLNRLKQQSTDAALNQARPKVRDWTRDELYD